MRFWLILAIIGIAQSCRTPDSPAPIPPEATIPAPVVVSPTPLSTQVFSKFCPDSLYSQYLAERNAQAAFKNSKTRLTNRKRRSLRYQARYQAVTQLIGEELKAHQIPHENHPNQLMWLEYFYSSRGAPTFLRWQIRGETHHRHLHDVFKKMGLPSELYYLAMVESGFKNHAYSRARATGMWQFVKPTAQAFGLKVQHWVDERRDPTKAAQAAGRYLTHLQKKFGHWYLAMAAYNAGPGRINRAIRRTGSRDFWTLAKSRYLHRETKRYVPKILAARAMGEHPNIFGFKLQSEHITSWPSTTIAVHDTIRLRDLARQLEIDYKLLRQWNPELIRNIVPGSQWSGPYPLRIAAHLAEKATQALHHIEKLAIHKIHIHTIKRGETLTHLAKKYQIKPQHILVANPHLKPRRLKIGHQIAIPVPSLRKRPG